MLANAPQNDPASNPVQAIEVGTRGKLEIMGKRFGVEVLDVGENGIRVSFPFADWPSDGIPVEFDVPTSRGSARYRATVAYEPETTYIAGLVLHDPVLCGGDLTQRNHCRVQTDLSVQVKAETHPRRFDAWVLNISVGGARLRSALSTQEGDRLALDMSLPHHCVESVPARVVYAEFDEESDEDQFVGIEFEDTSPEAASAISEYIECCLQASE